jgi:predicted  nucleic acid-binding Zn-ribbon protein
MAKVDDFLIIREYDSLSREANSLKTQMEEELARLRRREADLSDRQALLKTREFDMRSLNDQIAELDRKLAQRLSPEMAVKVEEEGLAMLIRQQELEVEIEEHKTFLAGFSKTVKDIREEIELNLSNQKMKRDATLERAQNLFTTLPEEWQKAYQKIAAKNPAHGVFTRLDGLKCQFCRGAVSKVFESEVDTQFQLKACPSCGRLVLPYKTVAG